MYVLSTGVKGFKAPPEAVHEASNPKIWVLRSEGYRIVWKGNESYGVTCDCTRPTWMGRDNERGGDSPNDSP